MGQQYASGKFTISQCDRCGFRFKLKQLKYEVVKTKLYQLKVCQECWDPDQPQLQLGMYPVDDPQAVRQPRPDTTYYTAGLNGLQDNLSGFGGFPTGGSRDIQWGWNPVGGASEFDSALTPNYLVATTYVGTAVPGEGPPANLVLGGVSSTGSAGTLSPPIIELSGVSAQGLAQGTSGFQDSGAAIAAISQVFNMPGAVFTQYTNLAGTALRFVWSLNTANLSAILALPAVSPSYSTFVQISANAAVGAAPPSGSPQISFGYTNGIAVNDSIYGYTELYVIHDFAGVPAPADGTYYIADSMQSDAVFFIPCPTNYTYTPPLGGYSPTYVNYGATCTLSWTGDAASTINSNYQVYPSIVGKYVKTSWVGSPDVYRGTVGQVTGVTYSAGTFTITMTTSTPMTGYQYINQNIVFLAVN